MEGNLIPGSSFGVLGLQGTIDVHHHQQHPHRLHQQHHHSHQCSAANPAVHDIFPLSRGNMHECDQTLSMVNYNNSDRWRTPVSDDEDETSFIDDGAEGHTDLGKGKKVSPWQRMKWNDGMVKLLINVLSYMGEDTTSECSSGRRRNFAILQKKGKWKLLSKVMVERGCYVSPQKCEDKFNDLNKRYKRLTDVLGRGTSCKIVENPALLDLMGQLSERAKEDVRKILSSKHLFYEEMCSYHNGNRLNLPADPKLQRSVQLALRSSYEHDSKRHGQDDIDEDAKEEHMDDRDDEGEDYNNVSRLPSVGSIDMNCVFPEGNRAALLQGQWMRNHLLKLEEQKLLLQAQMLELEKQHFEWQKFSRKKDRELDKLRMDNERIKLENERMVLELKHKELDADYN